MTRRGVGRVCRLAWDYPVNGEPTYGLQPVFVKLSEEQAKMGYDVHVVAGKGPSQPSEERVNGVQIHRLPVPFNLSALREVQHLVGGESDWVVHAHATCGIFLVGLRRLRKMRMVSHVHGASRTKHLPIRFKSGEIDLDYSELFSTYNMIRERSMWTSADRVLAVNKVLLNDIVESYGIDSGKGRVVYNGVDTELFRPDGNFEAPKPLAMLKGKRIILYAGHFGLRKGVFYLIRAMKLIKEQVPDSHLVCIGGVPSWVGGDHQWEILRKEIESNGVSEEVTLLDTVKNRELPAYYNSAEVFAIASYYESLSKVTMEAMASSLPVVTFDSGGMPELVEDGLTGRLVPYGSHKALAAAMIEILKDEKLARRMGEAGRAKMVSSFTWEAVAERIRTAYEEIA